MARPFNVAPSTSTLVNSRSNLGGANARIRLSAVPMRRDPKTFSMNGELSARAASVISPGVNSLPSSTWASSQVSWLSEIIGAEMVMLPE